MNKWQRTIEFKASVLDVQMSSRTVQTKLIYYDMRWLFGKITTPAYLFHNNINYNTSIPLNLLKLYKSYAGVVYHVGGLDSVHLVHQFSKETITPI